MTYIRSGFLPRYALAGIVLAAALAATWAAAPVASASQSAFYAGKTIRIIVGASAGGGLDIEARMLGRYLSRHVPGAPRVRVEAMPGAGGMVAATSLARTIRPDGLSLGYLPLAPVMAQFVGSTPVGFDVRRFEFVGTPYADVSVCLFSTSTGITSIDKWRASSRPLKLGATGPDSITRVFPLLLDAALRLPIRIVTGYRGTTEIRMAMASGELDGTCVGWGGVKAGWPSRAGISLVIQTGATPHQELPDVPVAVSLGTSPDARELLGAPLDAISNLGRWYALPPGTPRELCDILRRAFVDTMRDPDYVREARATGLTPAPIVGQAFLDIFHSLFKTRPALLSRITQALSR